MYEFKHPTGDLQHPVQQSNTGKKLSPVDERRKQFKDTMPSKRMGSIRTRRRIIMGQASTVSKSCMERTSMEVNKCTSTMKSIGIGFIKCILKYVTHDKGSVYTLYIKRGNTDMDQDLRELSREFPC